MNVYRIVVRCLAAIIAIGIALADKLPEIHAAAPVTITVNADQTGPRINPAMWGAFFEDINFGADGGLYAELVKNGSFEFPEPLTGWFKIVPSLAKGDVTVLPKDQASESAGHFAHITSQAVRTNGNLQRWFPRHGRASGGSLRFLRANSRRREIAAGVGRNRRSGWHDVGFRAACGRHR